MIRPAMEKLEGLYAQMDAEYGRLSRLYGLSCEGCDDNCCTQRFNHHTFAEYLFLLEGLKAADPELRDAILIRARVVVESYAHELQAGEIFKLMCPVNFNGSCALYKWRPMICRLHGLPHYFIMPDGARKAGGGCHRINAVEKATPHQGMDRTPFYTALAQIEKDVRERLGYRERFRKTTAQMLMDMSMEVDMEE